MCDKITILRGPERIRKRPAVIFGSEDLDGAKAAIKSLLDIFVTEAMLGHCSHIRVMQSGQIITVSGDDRGLYLGSKDAWKSLFCELFPGQQDGPAEEEYYFSFFEHHHGLYYADQAPAVPFLPDTSGINDLCALQCACKTMAVTVIREGVKSKLRFEKGYAVSGPENTATAEPSGTSICLQLDDAVFTDTQLDASFFTELLHTQAMLVPGLHIGYQNTDTGLDESYFFREGIAQYVRQQASGPVYTGELMATGKERYNKREYQAQVKVAFSPAYQNGAQHCYHNLATLHYGGTHLQAILSCICRALNYHFCSDVPPITPEQLQPHVFLVVQTWCSRLATVWENGSRESICNTMIRDMSQDLFRTEFENYIYANKDSMQKLAEQILASR